MFSIHFHCFMMRTSLPTCSALKLTSNMDWYEAMYSTCECGPYMHTLNNPKAFTSDLYTWCKGPRVIKSVHCGKFNRLYPMPTWLPVNNQSTSKIHHMLYVMPHRWWSQNIWNVIISSLLYICMNNNNGTRYMNTLELSHSCGPAQVGSPSRKMGWSTPSYSVTLLPQSHRNQCKGALRGYPFMITYIILLDTINMFSLPKKIILLPIVLHTHQNTHWLCSCWVRTKEAHPTLKLFWTSILAFYELNDHLSSHTHHVQCRKPTWGPTLK